MDGFYDGSGFGLTEGVGATIESMSGSRFSPIGGGEVSIAIDAIDILAGTFSQAIRVGLREDGYGGSAPNLGVVVKKAAETVGQLGRCGFVAVNTAEDEDGVGAGSKEIHDQGSALDGVAESYGADGAFVQVFNGRWDNFYGMWKRLGGPEATTEGDDGGEKEKKYQTRAGDNR